MWIRLRVDDAKLWVTTLRTASGALELLGNTLTKEMVNKFPYELRGSFPERAIRDIGVIVQRIEKSLGVRGIVFDAEKGVWTEPEAQLQLPGFAGAVVPLNLSRVHRELVTVLCMLMLAVGGAGARLLEGLNGSS